MEPLLLYLLLGAAAGLLAGLLGVGGGLIIVPVLAWILPSQGIPSSSVMHTALATSLATILFTSLSSVRAHHQRGAVRWDLVALLAPGILLGALLGAFLADLLPSSRLRQIFGLFELLVAIQIGLALIPPARGGIPGRLGNTLAGGGIGTLSALVGVGGGTLTVPYLVWCSVTMRQAVATSAACGLPIALAGTLGFVVAGWSLTDEVPWTLGYLYLPALLGIAIGGIAFAPLGAALSHRLPAHHLKRLFALLLAVLGIVMLLGG